MEGNGRPRGHFFVSLHVRENPSCERERLRRAITLCLSKPRPCKIASGLGIYPRSPWTDGIGGGGGWFVALASQVEDPQLLVKVTGWPAWNAEV